MLIDKLFDIKIKRLSLSRCETELTGPEAAAWLVSDKKAVVYIREVEDYKKSRMHIIKQDRLGLHLETYACFPTPEGRKWRCIKEYINPELVLLFSNSHCTYYDVFPSRYYSFVPYDVPFRDSFLSLYWGYHF